MNIAKLLMSPSVKELCNRWWSYRQKSSGLGPDSQTLSQDLS